MTRGDLRVHSVLHYDNEIYHEVNNVVTLKLMPDVSLQKILTVVLIIKIDVDFLNFRKCLSQSHGILTNCFQANPNAYK